MTEEWNNSVGERLLQLRNQKGMTQEDLAEYLNVSRQSVSKWELNKTMPDVEKLMLLSDLYEVTLDYLVKGREQAEETENTEEVIESTEEIEQSMEPDEGMQPQDSRLEMTVYRTVFLAAMIVSGILCVATFIFSFSLMGHHTSSFDDKQQEVANVNKIYEQYTLADVTTWDEDLNYYHQKVWLDIQGVREGDYIGYYYKEDNTNHALFKYYTKTTILPLTVSVLLLIFTIIFGMGFRSYGGKKQ